MFDENHRCYSQTRQHMLIEITRLDSQIKELSQYKTDYLALKKKHKKLVNKLHELNIQLSKML